ncbi:MAG TPA: hypothetical protein VJR49_01815, partial [Chthoniobacterales bacterium]|nr:hypothetical protein [Chthoniobacterales bacterium]
QRFAQFQTECHGDLLFEGEAHVAVAFFAGHFASKPPRRFEPAATGNIRKFNLRHDKTCMSTSININFDHNAVPWNLVTDLSQSSPSRARPESCELFRAQPDFAFFTMTASTDLKCERCSVSYLSQTNLSTGRLSGEIALVDNEMSPSLKVVRQTFD